MAHSRHMQAVAQLEAADTLAAVLHHSDVVVQRVRWRRLCAQAHAQVGAGCAAVSAARSGLPLALERLAYTCALDDTVPPGSANGPATATGLAHAMRVLRRAVPLCGGVLDLARDDVRVCLQEATQLLGVLVQAGDRRVQRDARGVCRALLRWCADTWLAEELARVL